MYSIPDIIINVDGSALVISSGGSSLKHSQIKSWPQEDSFKDR